MACLQRRRPERQASFDLVSASLTDSCECDKRPSLRPHYAHTVLTGVLVIAGKPIMHAPSMKTRPDADRFQRLLAALGMPGQMGQPRRTVDVHPVQLAFHTDARFVPMLQATRADPVTNALA